MKPALFLALLLFAVPARAEDRPTWSAGPDMGYVFLGPSKRLTGGLAIGAHGDHVWRFGEDTTLRAGLAASAIGVGGEGHWLGMLAGPTVGVTQQLGIGFDAGIALDAAYGRLPVCNDWGLCLRYWGLFPGTALHVSYGSDSTRVAIGVRARYVSTLGWTGVSWEPTAAARFAF